MKKKLFIFISILILSNSAFANISSHDYLKGWRVYSGDASNTTITENQNEVILKGNGIKSGYILGSSNSDENAWHNRDGVRFALRLTNSDVFTIYIPVETYDDGLRFLTYTTHPDHINKRGKEGRFIYIPLDEDEKVIGKSKLIERNLISDLNRYEPKRKIKEINGLMIRGDSIVTSINLQNIDSGDYYPPKTEKGFYENGSTYYKWRVYAGGESNAKIKADYYYPLKGIVNNPVVSLQGNGIKSGYILGAVYGDNAWHNTTQTKIKWKMIHSTIYTVYIPINTTQGIRYLTYTNHPDHRNKRGKEGRIIYMGTNNINADATRFTKNLRQDLAKYEPNNTLLEVNGFMVRGSCLIDKIKLQEEEKPKSSIFNVEKFNQLLKVEKAKLASTGNTRNVQLHHSKENIAWFTYDHISSVSTHWLKIYTLDKENETLETLDTIFLINYDVKFIENNTRMLLTVEDGFNKVERVHSYIYNIESYPFLSEQLVKKIKVSK